MTYRINTDKTAAVSMDVYYLPISTAPTGVSIVGYSINGVARIDKYNGKPNDLIGWAPLPRVPESMKGKR